MFNRENQKNIFQLATYQKMFADPIKFEVCGNSGFVPQQGGVFLQKRQGGLNIFKITICDLPPYLIVFYLLQIIMRPVRKFYGNRHNYEPRFLNWAISAFRFPEKLVVRPAMAS